MSVLIRQAVLSDAPALRVLNRAFNGNEVEPGWIERRLAAPTSTERVLVAEENGSVVGFCCLSVTDSFCRTEPRIEIAELFVDATSRRKGAGRKLVREAMRIGHEMGAIEVAVVTNQKNEAARRLYESSGFELPQHFRYRLKRPNQEPTPEYVASHAPGDS